MSRKNSIVSYDLDSDGNASNEQLVYQFPNRMVDGCQFDEHGRLWVVRWLNGTIDALDVEAGELVRSYPTRGRPGHEHVLVGRLRLRNRRRQ
jgi:sugar lactone lactonase YvrE